MSFSKYNCQEEPKVPSRTSERFDLRRARCRNTGCLGRCSRTQQCELNVNYLNCCCNN